MVDRLTPPSLETATQELTNIAARHPELAGYLAEILQNLCNILAPLDSEDGKHKLANRQFATAYLLVEEVASMTREDDGGLAERTQSARQLAHQVAAIVHTKLRSYVDDRGASGIKYG